ncbi:MAG TPA: agmatinase [Longimicrobiales bacterium]|nr:agmatinase [Longimicrobiales bacterium]
MDGLPAALRGLPWELPHTFLGLDEEASRFETAAAVILPVPYESTTSYGGGTRAGPRAILEASRYLELYDQELDCEPWEPGIATLPALELSRAGPEAACAELAEAYRALLDASGERFVVALGGEHAITAEPVLAWADRLDAEGRRLSVLQLDAHTDLRPAYEGTAHSHASVMHRVAERADIVAVGIRALTSDEARLVDARDDIRVFLADDIHGTDDWIDDAVEALGPDVYITLDVDGFDPSLVPSTGTPEPGGLQWYPVLELLRRVCERRTVHAADIVELAPIPGLHAPDFLVAKLLYKLIAYRLWCGR